MHQLTRKTIVYVCLMTLIAVVISGAAYLAGGLQRLEGITYDWRVKHYRADRVLPDDIAVVMIDEASLKAMNSLLGRWPWPRSVYGDVLDFLALGKPRAVVFDFLFTENEMNNRLGPEANDRRFAEATAETGVVYHAMQFFREKDMADNAVSLPREFGRFEFPLSGNDLNTRIDSRNNNFNIPVDGLYQAAKGIGVVNVEPDEDGVYRRVPLFINYQGKYFPSLSMAPILDVLGIEHIELDSRNIRMNDKSIPVDKTGHYAVNIYGRYNEFSIAGLITSKQMLDQGDVENLLVDPLEFKDKIIFIGTSATGLQDLKNTAIDNRLPGVLIHASTAGNILTNDFLVPADIRSTTAFMVILALFTCLSVLSTRQVIIQTVLPAIFGLGYWFWAMLQYSHNAIIEVVPPLLSMVIAWSLSTAFLVFTEGKEKKKVRMMLSQYVSPAVLKTVVDSHEDYIKAEVGVMECVTVLFSDIRGFTTLSETLDAQKIVHMLNYYFTEMTEAIFTYDGTIDKFIGDAIMAFWGAPVKIDDHAQKSVLAALEMNTRLVKVNDWLNSQGAEPIRTGIGIHTGDVIIGNIGSEKKLDYTVIGDNVNLASRLEGLTKEYRVPILISQTTYDAVHQTVPCQVVDLVRVKGKSIPIKVYAPVVDNYINNQIIDGFQLVETTNRAFEYYLGRDWRAAIDTYSSLPDEPLKQIFINRCQRYLENQPSGDWDGVFTMQTK